MDKVYPREIADQLPPLSVEALQADYLHSGLCLSRILAAIQIAHQFDQDYTAYSDLLLSEMNKAIHFDGEDKGVKSAWTIAIVLTENLKPGDYPRLKAAFSAWPPAERAGLLGWLADYPEQMSVLLV